MASKLPQFIALTSDVSKRGAYYMNENEEVRGYVSCDGSVFNPFAKIEVEASKSHPNAVHLRFVHSNKYWGLHGPDDFWIVASSVEPEEDTSKLSCTLFEPTFDNIGYNLYLNHTQSRGRLRVNHRDSVNFGVYVDKNDPIAWSFEYAFHVVDWDTLVKLPKYVAFKGDTDKYLKGVEYNNDPYLEFGQDDFNERNAANEVYLHPSGNLRIKSVLFDRFWRCSPSYWILADSNDASGEDNATLFWPVKIDDRTIAVKSVDNTRFCKRLTADGRDSCLNAAIENITTEARLVVEELVLEKSIYNVRYRMEDARVYDEQPFVAGIGSATNNSDQDSTFAITVSYTDTRSSSFTYTLSIELGITTTIQAGIPLIAEGKIEISASVTNTFEWGETTETSKAAEATYTVVVPARSRVIVNYVATEGKCSVPFSYTQRAKKSSDGSVVTSDHVDGIYYGVNYYSFHFEQFSVEPL